MRPVSLRAARRHVRRPAPSPWRALRRSPWPILGLLAVIVAAGTPWWPSLVTEVRLALQREAGIVLSELELHGAAQLDAQAVQTALALEPGMPLLELDVHDARQRLEALGWVEQATVSRRLPDRLVVEVKEHRPLALWLGPEGPALVAASGLPVSTDRLADHRHLPRLIGPEAPAEAPAVFRALAADPELLQRLQRLERLGSERWRLYLRPGVIVELPPGDTARAVGRLLEVQRATGVLDRAVAVLDLRVDGRLVVTPWPRLRLSGAPTGGAS
ncbi:MAG: cell division protein FtsQ/DivIB [Pseudomonadota bacterium]